jgi:hypothetical protein
MRGASAEDARKRLLRRGVGGGDLLLRADRRIARKGIDGLGDKGVPPGSK